MNLSLGLLPSFMAIVSHIQGANATVAASAEFL